jgi:hypothetical protein
MQDVSQGKERTRAWPEKRKKKLPQKTLDQMEWFRQAQAASKYMAPKLMTDAIEATQGHPLLPRDITTMMFASRLCMFATVDGRKVYPQVAYNDVSESLDVISQTPGMTLVRGVQQWEPQPFGIGSASWGMVASIPIAASTPNIDIALPPNANELIIMARNLTTSLAGSRLVRVSTNGGTSFFAGATDYIQVDQNGIAANGSAIISTGDSSTSARTILASINDLAISNVPKAAMNTNQNSVKRMFVADLINPINAIRISNSAGNILAGHVYLIAR